MFISSILCHQHLIYVSHRVERPIKSQFTVKITDSDVDALTAVDINITRSQFQMHKKQLRSNDMRRLDVCVDRTHCTACAQELSLSTNLTLAYSAASKER